jgi:formylglycine-generating enzyme required for sulfatase activity
LVGAVLVGAIGVWRAVRSPSIALSPRQELALKSKDTFQECSQCPQMLVVPAGSFTMGSPASEPERDDYEGPQHQVTIARAFSVGKFDVTRDEFAAFVHETGYDAGSKCRVYSGTAWTEKDGLSWRALGFAQTGSDPVACVDRSGAQAYVNWLQKKTGKGYRLLSESEWEYAARAGTTTAYYWGDALGINNADCNVCGSQWDAKTTAPVGSFAPNPLGLFDMAGNVDQWVADCWSKSYDGAPADGSASTSGDCGLRPIRGGSWFSSPGYLRSAWRLGINTDYRSNNIGFRVARTLAADAKAAEEARKVTDAKAADDARKAAEAKAVDRGSRASSGECRGFRLGRKPIWDYMERDFEFQSS